MTTFQPTTDSTQRFSSRVENYVKFRPGYPADVINLLRDACSLSRDSVVADIGSGTGLLARSFLEGGCRVFGIEPNREMRQAGAKFLKNYPGFTSIAATAEATALDHNSADLVTAGQAFHWFDREKCKAEFRRILRPNGWIALVWNARRTDTTPFLRDYEKLLHDYATDYTSVDHKRVENDHEFDLFFGPDSWRCASFDNAQVFDFERLKGRLLSSSYAPEAGQPGYSAMLGELRAIFARHQQNGQVAFEYDTRVYYGRLGGEQ